MEPVLNRAFRKEACEKGVLGDRERELGWTDHKNRYEHSSCLAGPVPLPSNRREARHNDLSKSGFSRWIFLDTGLAENGKNASDSLTLSRSGISDRRGSVLFKRFAQPVIAACPKLGFWASLRGSQTFFDGGSSG